MSNETTYYCPVTGEAFAVDHDLIEWDENGSAVVGCDDRPGHDVTIARPVSAGFGGGND